MPYAQPTSPDYTDQLNSLIGQSITPFPPLLASDLYFWLPDKSIDALREWVESERRATRDLPRGRPDCPQCGRLVTDCSCTDF